MPTGQQPRWQDFRDAAADTIARSRDPVSPAAGLAPSPAYAGSRAPSAPRPGGPARTALAALDHGVREALHRRRAGAPPAADPSGPRERHRRYDVRLVPAALLVWATAAAGAWLDPAALAGLCAGLAAAAGSLSLSPPRRGRSAARRSFRATAALALLLSCAAGAHSAVASAQRNDGALARAVANRASVVAELEVSGDPRRLAAPGRSGLSDRWAVPATLRVAVYDGIRVDAGAKVLVMGGGDWEQAQPGQRVRVTGRLKPAGAGEAEAGIFSASSAPDRLGTASGWERGPAALRAGFRTAAAGLSGDARGLLPGMVTGDTGALDPQLAAAMNTVGMTHLTAVSGDTVMN